VYEGVLSISEVNDWVNVSARQMTTMTMMIKQNEMWVTLGKWNLAFLTEMT
jgi:hypothetical protein